VIPDTVDQACGRSNKNYANLVATKLDLALTDASCQGATTDNVLAQQLPAVTPDTKFVTITIGGNNINYSVSTILCAKEPPGTSCLGNGVDTAATAANLQKLEGQLTDTLRAITQAAPSAKVFLVAYPRVLSADGKTCPPQNPMLPQDSKYIANLGAQLQRHSIAAAKSAKVTFIDAYTPKGHDVCASEAKRWIEGAVPESPAFVFHPNERAMQAEAAMVVKAMKVKPNGK
jgi:lysophospholipase L1-like esterase